MIEVPEVDKKEGDLYNYNFSKLDEFWRRLGIKDWWTADPEIRGIWLFALSPPQEFGPLCELQWAIMND